MFILDSLLINGIKFALDKVLQVAEQEMDNPETLQQQLLEAQMQLEEGAIDEETFAEIERDVFARLRELRGDEASGGVADSSGVRRSRDRSTGGRTFVAISTCTQPSADIRHGAHSALFLRCPTGLLRGWCLWTTRSRWSSRMCRRTSTARRRSSSRLADPNWVSRCGAAHHAVSEALAKTVRGDSLALPHAFFDRSESGLGNEAIEGEAGKNG